MTIHDELKYRQDTVESFLRIIDDLKRQIAKEERPSVGDTVLVIGRDFCGQTGVVKSANDSCALIHLGNGHAPQFSFNEIKLLSRATAPKPRRWYTQEEFITFMFAHPVILVRGKDGSDMRNGRPTVKDGDIAVMTYGEDVDSDNFFEHEYSLDGKTWLDFGMEES